MYWWGWRENTSDLVLVGRMDSLGKRSPSNDEGELPECRTPGLVHEMIQPTQCQPAWTAWNGGNATQIPSGATSATDWALTPLNGKDPEQDWLNRKQPANL